MISSFASIPPVCPCQSNGVPISRTAPTLPRADSASGAIPDYRDQCQEEAESDQRENLPLLASEAGDLAPPVGRRSGCLALRDRAHLHPARAVAQGALHA